MPTYQYEAADAQGRTERGRLHAENARHARQSLRARGLLALSVREAGLARGIDLRVGARLSDTELGWMTRQIATLLRAHLSLEAALAATLEQAEHRPTQQVLASVLADVRAGHRLGQALAAHPRIFPEVYRALVDAGEQAGDIARVMTRLADYIESRGHLRNKVLTAFIYPAIVTLVSIAIIVFMLSTVVPQVVGAFSRSAQELPLLTRAMLAGSHFVQHWGMATGLGLAGLFAVWRLHLRQPAARLAWHARKLRLPVLGRYALGVDVARFAATLAILTDSGVPLLAALQAAQRTLANDKLRAAVKDVTERVREGAPLAQTLAAQQVFPALLVHMVASGERSGELPAMLQHAAQTLSADLERRAMTLTALLEPIMILVMGGIVLLIVLAIMLPILEINQLVR